MGHDTRKTGKIPEKSRKREVYKNMRAAYALNVRMKPSKDENKMQCTQREMGMGGEVVITRRTDSKRSALRSSHPTTPSKIPNIPNGP